MNPKRPHPTAPLEKAAIALGSWLELYYNAGAYVTPATTDGSVNFFFPGLTANNYLSKSAGGSAERGLWKFDGTIFGRGRSGARK